MTRKPRVCENGASKNVYIIRNRGGPIPVKKRLFTAVLAALLLLSALPAASAAGDAVLSDSVVYDCGMTRISWSVSGSGADTYNVYAQITGSGNVRQALVNLGSTSGTSLETSSLAPGKEYEITLADGNFRILDTRTYRLAEAPVFQDGKLKNTSVKISTEARKMKAGGNPKKDIKKIGSFKAKDIEAAAENDSEYYGLKFTMRMPQLVKHRAFFVTVAFESPDGFYLVDWAKSVEFERVNRGYETIWLPLAGYNFFRNLYRITGSVPKGRYQIHLFWDGMWVNTVPFSVN